MRARLLQRWARLLAKKFDLRRSKQQRTALQGVSSLENAFLGSFFFAQAMSLRLKSNFFASARRFCCKTLGPVEIAQSLPGPPVWLDRSRLAATSITVAMRQPFTKRNAHLLRSRKEAVPYSLRSASTGSLRAAAIAGNRPATKERNTLMATRITPAVTGNRAMSGTSSIA